jgi:type I restriction enzyme M protein
MSIGQSVENKILKIIWSVDDLTRGSVDIEDTKGISLALFFLKALSDQYELACGNLKAESSDVNEEDIPERLECSSELFPFVIPKEARFSFLLKSLKSYDNANLLANAFHCIEKSNPELSGIFSDAELLIQRLSSSQNHDKYFADLIIAYSEIDLRKTSFNQINMVGEIFIQIIQRYDSIGGKKNRESFTPLSITRLLAQLLEPNAGDEIYDPACGSGTLLASLFNSAKERCNKPHPVSLYGQERNISTYNLARMNLILNGVVDGNINCGDALLNPIFLDYNLEKLRKFDIAVSNPPFSLSDWGSEYVVNDVFSRFKWGTPPKSKGDYAFISHMLSSLKDDTGRMAVVVPHGVLFRGSAEGKIRTNIIRDNLLDAVIGLPQNLFSGTSIPTAIMIFSKQKVDETILFIDARNEYVAGKNKNSLSEENVCKIHRAYKAREEISSYSRKVSIAEVISNDFNLNISRYVSDFKEEESFDLDGELVKRNALQYDLKTLECEMESFLSKIISKS